MGRDTRGAMTTVDAEKIEETVEAQVRRTSWKTNTSTMSGVLSALVIHDGRLIVPLPPRTHTCLYTKKRKKSKAVNERMAETELRLRFRMAIPHAGPDPTYALRPFSRLTQQHRHHQPPQQRASAQEHQSFPLLSSSPSSTSSSPISESFSANATAPPQGGQDGEGEGYAEPAYITRQRCLVLNDWALSLFESGGYAKVRARKQLKQ